MNIDAFRCMRQGNSISTLYAKDEASLAPIYKNNGKNKSALLLLHGFSSTPAVFRHLIPSLDMYDAVLCPTLAGHGESIEAFALVKYEEWLKQSEELCKELQERYERVDVMGLSLGGLLACHLSTQFNINHLYLLAPALDLKLALKRTLTLARLLNWLGFQCIRSAAGNLYGNQHCEIAYRQLPISAIIQILTLIKQFQLVLPTCPTDLFLGCHDKVIAPEKVAKRFENQSNVEIHWLKESAHVLPLDSNLSLILDCINKHI